MERRITEITTRACMVEHVDGQAGTCRVLFDDGSRVTCQAGRELVAGLAGHLHKRVLVSGARAVELRSGATLGFEIHTFEPLPDVTVGQALDRIRALLADRDDLQDPEEYLAECRS